MRLSVSDIDLFHKYLDEEADISLKEVLRQLRREEKRPWYMDAGNAFHKVLEHAHVGEVSEAECDGYRFQFELDSHIALPEIREMKGELQVETSVGPVTLVGKLDGFHHSVRDIKLTSYFKGPERYLESYQWRCYLVMFKSFRFDYDVFTYREPKKDDPKLIVVDGYHTFSAFAYPNMERDVVNAVDRFAQFVAEYLPEKRDLDWTNDPFTQKAA